MIATLNHPAQGKANASTNTQAKMLTDLVKSLLRTMEEQKEQHANHLETLTKTFAKQKVEHANQLETLTKTFTQQIEALKAEIAERTEKIQAQLSSIQASSSASPSYAEIARTPPTSHASNIRSLSSIGTTPSTMTNTLYCTIDTSRMGEEDKNKAYPGSIRKTIEEEMRAADGHANWRCAAVIKDSRNAERVKVACRDEAELHRVKEVAQKTAPPNARVLRDQLYLVKVDNANRTAILDQEGNILPRVTEVLGKENEVNIAKIAWLSRKNRGKVYGSIVVYITKGNKAARLLREQYFHVAGESVYTRVYEHRVGPTQCYNY
jgi:hypothetical protein